MSRKDYVLLANALKSATPLMRDGDEAHRAWFNTVERVAQALQNDNPRFDRSRFISATRGE